MVSCLLARLSRRTRHSPLSCKPSQTLQSVYRGGRLLFLIAADLHSFRLSAVFITTISARMAANPSEMLSRSTSLSPVSSEPSQNHFEKKSPGVEDFYFGLGGDITISRVSAALKGTGSAMKVPLGSARASRPIILSPNSSAPSQSPFEKVARGGILLFRIRW